MMLSVDDIKKQWPGAAFNIDDSEQNDEGKTAYDLYVESEINKVIRRMQKWLGVNVISDAISDTPENTERAFDINEAISSLINAQMIEYSMRIGAMGVEKEVALPSGTRVILALYSRDDFERAIKDFSDEAYRAVEEYL